MRFLKLLWAGPASLIGLMFAPLFRTRRIEHGVFVCTGARWRFMTRWRYRAITLGHVVLCIEEIPPATMQHELVHVAQYERWGALLIPAYLVASVAARARGGHHYRDNHFERQARALSERDRGGHAGPLG